MTKPEQRPEGALLAEAIKASGLSQREVARRAGLSEGRLRQIINGYISAGRSQYADVIAPPARIAEIARVLGVTSEELRQAGRDDAAEILERAQKRTSWMPDGDGEVEESYYSIQAGDDDHGHFALGAAGGSRRDGSADRVEVKYWPGDGYEVKPMDFGAVVRDAMLSARRQAARIGMQTRAEEQAWIDEQLQRREGGTDGSTPEAREKSADGDAPRVIKGRFGAGSKQARMLQDGQMLDHAADDRGNPNRPDDEQ